MRTMYDAVTASNILRHNPRPALVAGYVDKIRLEPWSGDDWALFPAARKVTIVKKASTRDGHVLDVEIGDATPDQAPSWAAQRRRDGFAYPVIYCNRSTWPLVKQAFADQNVAPPLYWIATASGQPVIPDGAIAAQYLLDYQGVDVSVVADYWPGVDPAPAQGDDDDMTPDERLMLQRVYGQLTGTEDVHANPAFPGFPSKEYPTSKATPVDFVRAMDQNVIHLLNIVSRQSEQITALTAKVDALTPKTGA
jgi:hypothetical protein